MGKAFQSIEKANMLLHQGDTAMYMHPHFNRSKPEDCNKIKRKTKRRKDKKTGPTAASSDSLDLQDCEKSLQEFILDEGALFKIEEPSAAGVWTEEEDQLLRDHAMLKGVKAVKKAGLQVPALNKTELQCAERWKELTNPPVVKRLPWTQQEDDRLIQTVGRVGAGKWTIVASYIRGRAAKQCRCAFPKHMLLITS